MAQHDMDIANQSFPNFRTDLNNALASLNSMHSGTSRPSGAVVGTMWLDTTNSASNSLEIKFFDGSDDISFATVDTSANTINFIDSTVTVDIVNDTSPQLGADLDTNSFNIKIDDAHGINDDDGNELVIFQKTASAVNELEITNGATGDPPILGASGETNVDIHLKPKGSGETIIGSGGASATLTTSGTHDLILDTNKGTNSGNITITDGANGNISLTPNGSGNVVLDGISFPNADGSADQVLKTNGSGALSFGTAGGGGKVGQVVQTVKTDVFSTSSTSFTDVTGLTVDITPSASTSKVLVLLDYKGSIGRAGAVTGELQLLRGSTVVYQVGKVGTSTGDFETYCGTVFLDSPNSTSQQTYKIQIKGDGGVVTCNRVVSDSGDRADSSITVMEITA